VHSGVVFHPLAVPRQKAGHRGRSEQLLHILPSGRAIGLHQPRELKKWWKELATAQGCKDYDWPHLAARYFPSRVREKCVQAPSLAVAHHCLWELHS
jgi:hypothetical protein